MQTLLVVMALVQRINTPHGEEPKNAIRPVLLWEGGLFPAPIGVAAEETTVFISANGILVARDLATGKQRWSHPVRKGQVADLFDVGGSSLLIQSIDGELTSIRKSDGSTSWSVKLPCRVKGFRTDGISAMGECNESSTEALIVAINTITGALQWQYRARFGAVTGPLGRSHAFALMRHDIGTWIIQALNRRTGKPEWTRSVPDEAASFFIYRDEVIVLGETIVAFREDNGTELWRVEGKSSDVRAMWSARWPAVYEGLLLLPAAGTRQIYGIALATGKTSKTWILPAMIEPDDTIRIATWANRIFVWLDRERLLVEWRDGKRTVFHSAASASESEPVGGTLVTFPARENDPETFVIKIFSLDRASDQKAPK